MNRYFKSVIFCSIVLTMTACGNEGSSDEDQLELNWQTTINYSPDAPTQGNSEYLTNKLEEFHNDNPNINVNVDTQSNDIDEAMSRLLEQANSGRAPDVAPIDSYLFEQYFDHLQPLNDLFDEFDVNVEDYMPFAQDVITDEDGTIYGMYMNTDTRVLFYDTTVIPEPPSTWDELISVGLDVQEEGFSGIMLPGGRNEGTSVTTIWPLFWGLGGELVDDDGEPVFGEGENREIMLQVLEKIEEAVVSGALPQRVASYGGENDLNEELATGNTAMFIGGNWQDQYLQEALGEEEYANWDVAPVPMLDESADPTSSAGGWAWGIFTEDPEKQEAAFELIHQMFTGEDGMAEFSTVYGGLPSRESVFDSDLYEGSEFTEIYREILEEDAQVRPSSSHYNAISNQMQIAVSSVISGSKTPEEALDDAWNAVN